MSATKKKLSFDMNVAPASMPPAAAPEATPPSVSKAKTAERKQVGARVNADAYRQLKVRATMMDKTISDLVEQAITEFLANHPA